ncbi:MAG: hypothetical protein JWP97_1333 [Labilithrix sp.]|nr:hypothetical protein [Labilithrix sp.]
MGSTRPPNGKAKVHDSLAQTRAVPVVDELAETREGMSLTMTGALLDAAEVEMSLRGFGGMNAEGVAERAGVAVDVLHAHYPDMAALLRAANERFVQQVADAVEAATATGSWYGSRVGEVVEIAVRSLLEVVEERQALVQACLLQGPADPALVAGLRRIGTHFTARLVAAVRECIDAPASSDRAVGFSLLTAAAIAHHVLLMGDGWAGITFTRDELTAETTRMITAYLAATASRPAV